MSIVYDFSLSHVLGAPLSHDVELDGYATPKGDGYVGNSNVEHRKNKFTVTTTIQHIAMRGRAYYRFHALDVNVLCILQSKDAGQFEDDRAFELEDGFPEYFYVQGDRDVLLVKTASGTAVLRLHKMGPIDMVRVGA